MLFLKECRRVLFSLTFLIYIAAVSAFYWTQFLPETREPITPPSQGLNDYGTVAKEDPTILMPAAAKSLVMAYLRGYYVAYPIGFYKEVKLSEKKSVQMAQIIEEITGITRQELDGFSDFDEGGSIMQPDGNGGYVAVYQEPTMPDVQVSDTVTYDRFRELMRKADAIIGGGSDYSDDNIVGTFSRVPRTYEDALKDYEELLEKDRISGAYARLFCDYMGIIVSILPVFAAAALANADRKSRMEQLIYARKISSARLVFTRYAALVSMLMIPILILAGAASVSIARLHSAGSTDLFAIPGLSICWLLPNILFSAALGMALTELLSPLTAVFAQGVLWVGSVMSPSNGLTGCIGRFTLVCRHNSLYGRYLFTEDIGKFTCSRIFYSVLALAVMVLTVGIYSKKRKGGLNVYRKDRVRKSKA